MKTICVFLLLTVTPCVVGLAQEPVALPRNVPPVVATAIAPKAPERWTLELTVPKISWKVVGEKRPKIEWPEFKVKVEETVLTIPLDYDPATQLSAEAQNRVVDLKGRRLERLEAARRLKEKTPVLLSVSGQMPDAFYLQCTKPDTLIVILGLPDSPAPQLLPQEAKD